MIEDMDCSKCETYLRTQGIGKLECKKCRHYKNFQIRNTPRSKLIFENLTELIKESVAEEQKTLSIVEHISKMPREFSVPLTMYYLLNMSLREIALYHNYSKSKVDSIIKNSVMILKTMLE